MKSILLAAAMIATPVIAQTTTTTTPDQTTTTTTTPSTTPSDQTTPPAATTGAGAMQQDQMPPATTQTGTTSSTPMATSGDPVGGYAPAGPGYSGGTPGAGARVVFQPAPTPDQAFPAPAPLASYPICKKGQFDHCMQGRNSTHSREVRGRRSGGR